jgi:hypothetical protein
MNKTRAMKAAFEPKQHLENCLGLPARNPEPYYRPGKKERTRYLDECVLLTRHEEELEKLRGEGVPFYLAEALVLTAYAHTRPTLEKRVKEAAKL